MRPHRQQPTRLRRPWDSPGKNTGVGCHFLLQCMKVKSQSEVAQSCPTLSDPMDCSLPGSSVHWIFQARVLEWGAIAFIIRDMQINNTMRCHFTPVIMTFLKRKTNIGEDAEKKQLLSTLYFSVDHLVMSMCRVFPCIVGRECLL